MIVTVLADSREPRLIANRSFIHKLVLVIYHDRVIALYGEQKTVRVPPLSPAV